MNYTERMPITKGWSSDKKYRITGEDGKYYLLRISDVSQKDTKRAEFDMMSAVAERGVPMCLPIEFGVTDEGVYSIQSWIGGSDAEDVIPKLTEGAQYEYGLEAGKILKKIHSIPAPQTVEDWEIRFNRKLDRKIKGYLDCPLRYDGGEAFIEFIEANRGLLHDRPQSYQHGDYHIGNMMLDEDGKLTIIDFNRNDYGDPWEEFNRIVWCAEKAPHFASGIVDGYFDGTPPIEFWRILALYISSNTLSSLYWAIPFGEGEIKTMRDQARAVLEWYRNMTEPTPTWYTGA